MKYRIVVWDPIKSGLEWLDQNANEEEMEIVDTIETDVDAEGVSIENIMCYEDQWDYLLIFAGQLRSMVDNVLQLCQIPAERVIFPQDIYSLREHYGVATRILKEADRRIAWVEQRELHDYVTCTVDGLSYIAPSWDNCIIANMYVKNYNFAMDEIQIFHALSQKYYHFTEQQIYFCDIGANIGTTSIYFKKKLEPEIRILAIEALELNYRLLKINYLLNGMELSEEKLLHCAVGDTDKESVLYVDPSNGGGSSMIFENSANTQVVYQKRFDTILSEQGIEASELKYIWVDVEGYEYFFLKGGLEIFRQIQVPIVLEIIASKLKESNIWDPFMELLEQCFDSYAIIQEMGRRIYPIADLRKLGDVDKGFDVFLIRQ